MPFLFLIVIQLLEEAKNVLAGLADESLELGENGIFKRKAPEAPKAPDAPDAPETVKAPEKKKAPEGDKVSSDEGKKPDADNKNAETDKKAKPKKKQSRKKKKAAKKAEAKKAGVTRYDLDGDSFREQLSDYKTGLGKAHGSYNGEYFNLGTTPKILRKHGAANADIIMREECLVKITGGKHSISYDEISKLPEQLNDPILLFKGSQHNSLVALTEMKAKNGHDVIVAIFLKNYQDRTLVNRIASIYSKTDSDGKNKIIDYVEQQISFGNLLDASTKKAPIWFTSRGLQLPKLVQTIIDANNSISQKSKKSTENGKKVERKMLAEDAAAVNEAQEAAEGEIEGDSTPEMTERERRRGYTDAEADAARAIIKDFDTMPRSKRLAITAFVRSCGGNNIPASFKKHAAAMMAHWRKGLWIIVDNKSIENGFYRSFPDGSRLIVVNPAKATGKGATDIAYMHELGHDIWTRANAEMRKDLYALATEGTTREERIGVRNRYRAGFEARGLKINNEVIREEIFTEFMSKALGNPKFFDRFDMSPTRKKGIWQMMKSTYRMAKCFFGKDKQLYMRSERMATAIARVMGRQMVSDIFGVKNGTIRYLMGVTQEDIDNYVKNSYIKTNTKDYIPYAEVSEKLISDVEADIDVTGYIHALRDNDIRHIKNSHGEETTEKYPVTKEDIAKIPYIISNYDKVYVKTNARQEAGLVYVKVGGDNVVYYVEAVTTQYHNQKLLVNKQMIKTGFDEIPNLRGLIDAINKKEGESQYLADLKQIRKAYVRDVKEIYPNNSISQNPKKSTKNAKKVSESDGIVDRKSLDDDLFDKDRFFANAMENGGVISHEEAEKQRLKRRGLRGMTL